MFGCFWKATLRDNKSFRTAKIEVFGSSDKVLEKPDSMQVISRSQDGSRKLDRFKRLQMGKRRPQMDSKHASRKIVKFENSEITKLGLFPDKYAIILQNSETKMVRMDHI